ncbi:unnamed protein product [Clonostachys solani]|uniref:Cupin type-1 domain-containing protein n=1 Tax=Clonostachys solani TaxID=160281 RepID=A0A9N9Z8G4_9HYPO|nr:unnamed protein product [Clonostachys solani]
MAKMELVRLESTKYVPNSTFPVIIYRNVLPVPDDQDAVKALLNGNGFRVDGFFGPYGLRHYHSNTHETYAFTAGQSTIILGRSESPDDENGTEIQVSKGDVLIIPAGTAHCNKTSSDDFLYAASYPKVS